MREANERMFACRFGNERAAGCDSLVYSAASSQATCKPIKLSACEQLTLPYQLELDAHPAIHQPSTRELLA